MALTGLVAVDSTSHRATADFAAPAVTGEEFAASGAMVSAHVSVLAVGSTV